MTIERNTYPYQIEIPYKFFLLNTLWCCRRTVIDFVKKTAATDSSEVFIVGKCIPMCPMFVSINEDTKAIHIASPW